MKATTSGSTVTGPAARAASTEARSASRNSGTCRPVAALSVRWSVGGRPANDICGWTYQSRAAISTAIVNTSQLPSVASATSVESGGTTTRSAGSFATPSTIRSTASSTSRPRRAAYGSTQPPMQASTWHRTPRSAATAPTSVTGSTTPWAYDGSTVLVVASAPSYAHGVVDPVTEIAAAAAARGVRCHVDACIGGWVLPYAARLGRPVRPWSFAVDGVTSVSVDLHKYAYAPKGTSILLHRTPALRAPQFFASADWPGYTMLNASMQSTKSGGPLAAAWAVVHTLGDSGYATLSAQVFEAVDRIVAGIGGPLRVVVPPDSTLITLATDDSCDPFTICDEMAARGWYVQPQMSYAGSPATIHLSVSAATLASVEDFLTALGASVQSAVEAGPVRLDPEVVAFIEALDPSSLSDQDFDGLLAASGLVSGGGGLDLPERMAEVNALLDVAAPAMREALLKAFLDRLSRPTR